MVVNVLPPNAGFLFQSTPRSHVNLASDDGLDIMFFRGLIEFDRTVHDPMIRDRERIKLKLTGSFHQSIDPAGSIENRKLGVEMEVCELCL